jgi:predicted GTPase
MEIVNDAKALTSLSSSQDNKGGFESVDTLSDPDLKIILLGDSAVGKSKLIERYLMDEYNPRQVRTYTTSMSRLNTVTGCCLCFVRLLVAVHLCFNSLQKRNQVEGR